jgi:hypothetical protein
MLVKAARFKKTKELFVPFCIKIIKSFRKGVRGITLFQKGFPRLLRKGAAVNSDLYYNILEKLCQQEKAAGLPQP